MQILLVEDNPADADIMTVVLTEIEAGLKLTVAEDGLKALSMMTDAADDGGCGLPDLVMIDINLPGLNGVSLLAAIRADPRLASIPVLALSSSESPADVRNAYRHGCNCYVRKPANLKDYRQTIGVLHQFWRHIAILPSEVADRHR